jgi:hypothetical protein
MGNGAGGSYQQFSSVSATGARAIEGGAVVIGLGTGLGASYGTSQTTTFTADDAGQALAEAFMGVYGPVIDDLSDDGN